MERINFRRAYSWSYGWLRFAYGEGEANGQTALTKPTQAAIESFANRHAPFTGWVNLERYERWYERNSELDPCFGIPF